VEILKQGQYSPFPVEQQVAMIYLGTKGLLADVPVNKVKEFEGLFLASLTERFPEALNDFKSGKLTDEAVKAVTDLAAEITSKYKK